MEALYGILQITCTLLACYAVFNILEVLWRLEYIKDYKDKHVMVTGCDSGFGHAAAIRLDGLGLNIFACCFTEEGANKLLSVCSTRLKVINLDITNHKSIQNALKTVKDTLPPNEGLWGIANNAGISSGMGPVEWSTREDFSRVLEVNTFGQINMTLTFLPLLKKSGGRIIFTTSSAALDPGIGLGAYSSSKYATSGFADVCRRALRPYGVQVHTIVPAFYITGIYSEGQMEQLKEALSGTWKRLSQEKKDEYGSDYYNKWTDPFCEFVTQNASTDLRKVISCMEHALLAKHPKTRYPCESFSKYVTPTIHELPEWLGDKLLIRIFNVPPPAS